MNSILVVGVVVSIALSIFTSMTVLIPYLSKKGIKVDDVLSKADMVLDGADKAVEIAKTLVPNNPVVNIIAEVEKYAHIGVNQAEQLYIASSLPKDQRNAKAKETIYAALKVANIEVTPEIEQIIEGVIEAETLALGHSNPETKAVVTNLTNANAQLEAQLSESQQQAQQLQSQVNSQSQLVEQLQALQTENANLRNKIVSIESAIQS